MHVSALVWAVTLVVLIVIFAVDLLIIGRKPHEPPARETAIWVGVYVALAAVFGVGLLAAYGTRYGDEFFAGWVTEYSLSADNLFIFMIIMARFAVPRVLQQRVLLIGVILALLMRGVLIAAGAAVVDRFVWVFYLFGAFLIYTAIALLRQRQAGPDDFTENVLIRWGRRILPMSAQYDGARLTTRAEPGGRAGLRSGRRIFTPMFIVVIAIGTTDLIFALDSIPAVFGLTTQAYIVFTANVFALMGLRQLYFLLGGLLDRLAYLSFGLAAVLGFIGIKLILDALNGNNVFFVNGGESVGRAPRIPIWLSLVVIISALGVAAIASLVKASRDASRQRAKAPAADIEAGPSGSTVGVSRSDRMVDTGALTTSHQREGASVVTLDRQDGVFVLDLGDTENRFHPDWIASVSVALEEVEQAEGPCALVTAATGKFFSNGLDLEWLMAHSDQQPEYIAAVHGLFVRVLSLPMITVAALQGHTFAAGAMLSLAHDFRVMRADRGFWCLPEAEISIPFTPGMSALIQARLTPQTAHEAMTTARRFGGRDALAAAIVDRSVDEDAVRRTAIEIAQAQAGKAGPALGTIKARMYRPVLDALRDKDALG